MPNTATSSVAHRGTKPEVTLLGDGRLLDAIAAAVAGQARVTSIDDATDAGPVRGVLVAATDGWHTRSHSRARDLARADGVPWLPVRTELRRAIIGPLEHPRTRGCVDCAEERRRRAHPYPDGYLAVREEHADALAGPSPWLTGLAGTTVGALVADEVLAAQANDVVPRTRQAVLVVRLDDLDIGVHRFLPVPDCPQCGTLPDDAAAAARLRPRSRPKPAEDVYRVRPADRDRLVGTYVDREVGIVRALASGTDSGLVVTRAPMWLAPGVHEESGWGRAHDVRGSEAVALLEALERYGGGRPGGRRTVVRAAARDVVDDAIDPRSLGLYPPQRQDEPGHRFPPYDDTQVRRWVWGYSFGRDRPVLVPENYAYYRTRRAHPDDPPLVYEPSNGCAVGGCVEEAVLYGLLEVLERDAFLLTWHARLSVPRIELATAADPLSLLLATEIEHSTGYRVRVLDTTTEHAIPSVMAIAVNDDGSSDRPAFACAAGAHLDPHVAVRSALSELGPILAHLIRTYPTNAHRAAAMLADPHQVIDMEDHALLYAHPGALDRLDFLLRADHGDQPPDRPEPPTPRPDLRDDLMEAVHRVLGIGLDVIVVDQTTDEHRAADLHCVKVIVPGALPITFGHVNRRLDGLPRLLTVPKLLGYRDRDLRPDEVCQLPHPFP